MPFSVVVVEDQGSYVLLADRNPEAIGLMQERLFIDCMPIGGLRPEGDIDENIGEVLKLAERASPDSCIVVVGGICPRIAKQHDRSVEACVLKVFAGSAISPMYGPIAGSSLDPVTLADTKKQSSKNAMTVLEELIELRKPHKWRMRRVPSTSRPQPHRPVPRSSERIIAVPVLIGEE